MSARGERRRPLPAPNPAAVVALAVSAALAIAAYLVVAVYAAAVLL